MHIWSTECKLLPNKVLHVLRENENEDTLKSDICFTKVYSLTEGAIMSDIQKGT